MSIFSPLDIHPLQADIQFCPQTKPSERMKKIILGIVIGLVVLLVAGILIFYFSLNSLVKKGVETVGPKVTKTDVKLGAVKLSPFSGSGELSQFVIGNPEGYKTPSAFQFGNVKLAVQPSSVFSDVVVIDEINIQAPEINFEGSLDGANNLSKLLDNLKSNSSPATQKPAGEKVPAPAGEKKEKKFIVKKFVLDDAKLHLSLTVSAVSFKPAAVQVAPVHLDNIGVAENGVTASELSTIIMKPLLTNVVEAVKKSYDETKKSVDTAIKNIENIGKGSNSVNKAMDSVTNLIKFK